MLLGIPTEIKNHEYRVGMTPEAVQQAILSGHDVVVQSGAGAGIGEHDDAYRATGAVIVDTAEDVFKRAEMVVKVKEPLKQEVQLLRKGQVLFTFLHLAANRVLTQSLVKSGAICFAYETVMEDDGHLPLLAPMSKVAGRLATQVAAQHITRPAGGVGKLIGGVPGVEPAKVVIVGGGVVGRNAARIAVGMGARVVVLERNPAVMAEIDTEFNGRVITAFSNVNNIYYHLRTADIVIGAALQAGAAAPKVISEEMVKTMRPRSVIVDVAIDQGGCVATAKPTTHDNPTYVKHEIIHYCVTNMPGIVPRTSTYALSNATLPFVLELANKGWRHATLENSQIKAGLSVAAGQLVCQQTAASLSISLGDKAAILEKQQ